jgi:site-specific DNA-cytosine methylase
VKYLSVCSGIEAASCAWQPLGWSAAAFSEVDPFASAVLAHRHPSVPNIGDMTRHKEWSLGTDIDLLIGGTPCQSFSVAGLRRGMADPRECERLQGFPDDYTLVPYRGRAACDGPRYRAIGNSMAVNVMSWVGQRIAAVDVL